MDKLLKWYFLNICTSMDFFSVFALFIFLQRLQLYAISGCTKRRHFHIFENVIMWTSPARL